ncbi:YaaC family protein [Bacillus litorisediminis]|uniref:YaaC family protein n=1 Tax=Bacillus litorisediminis TaxID=2922713 RepID=UPI001FAE29BE|nr:YaaC family protein [Bacillus litorisediminis]
MISNSIWSQMDIFMSASFVQKKLKTHYLKHNYDSQKSYENTYRFMYFLEQGKAYYMLAEQSPLSIKPTLIFYGYIHLIKACILLADPNYPETTSVLAHGVTARKRKKQNYSFLKDEIKIQKNGLFPHMSMKMFHMKHLEGEKWSMHDLLKEIPELEPYISELIEEQPLIKLNNTENTVIVPEQLLDHYHLSIHALTQHISGFFKGTTIKTTPAKNHYQLSFSKPVFTNANERLPFRIHIGEKQYWIRTEKTTLQTYPELLVHYLILYNLSMIARYETDWWCDLIKTMPNEEYPLISSFLRITALKGPYLIYYFIRDLLKEEEQRLI